MFPIIPVLALVGIIGGGATLAWYSNLSKREQYEANRKANAIALRLFKKQLNQLSESQYNAVMDRTRKELDA